MAEFLTNLNVLQTQSATLTSAPYSQASEPANIVHLADDRQQEIMLWLADLAKRLSPYEE